MVSHVLKHDNKTLCELLIKINELKQLKDCIATYLTPEAIGHYEVIKLEKNCLFLLVENGHWTTHIRFQAAELINHLKKHSALDSLKGIICKTRPTHSRMNRVLPKKRKRLSISESTAKTILETTQNIKDPKLRQIFEKIARYRT